MTVTDNARLAHAELTRIWGAKPKVYKHADESEEHTINIAFCNDSPFNGCVAVGTVGLSDHDLGMGPVRVELVGAFPANFEDAPNIAATCAFNAFKSRIPTRPDAIHENVIGIYIARAALPHVLMTDPFLWDDGPRTLHSSDFDIAWLMMVPISESERVFAKTHGAGALTSIFEDRQIDIFDLNRATVV